MGEKYKMTREEILKNLQEEAFKKVKESFTKEELENFNKEMLLLNEVAEEKFNKDEETLSKVNYIEDENARKIIKILMARMDYIISHILNLNDEMKKHVIALNMIADFIKNIDDENIH
jgi:hypothetical protein